jgi:hypothetical protein
MVSTLYQALSALKMLPLRVELWSLLQATLGYPVIYFIPDKTFDVRLDWKGAAHIGWFRNGRSAD